MSAGKKGKLMCERSHNDCLMVQSCFFLKEWKIQRSPCSGAYKIHTYTHKYVYNVRISFVLFCRGNESSMILLCDKKGINLEFELLTL